MARSRPSVRTVVIAVLAGVVVLVLLVPGTVLTSDPPQCFALLFYPVPCAAWVAWAAAAAVAGIVGLVLWMNERRR